MDDGYFETPADLIVEIVGLSNPQSRLDQKVEEYLTMGCGMVWVVDPRKKTLTVHRHLDHAQQLQVNDSFDGGDLLPGLSFTIADLFEDQADSTAGLRPAARQESEEGRHDGCPY